MLTLRLAASTAVLVSSAAAQTVWSMGAPWTDLAAVIASAAPGDIVQLNGLTFAPFVLNKGLTILGPGVIRPLASTIGQTSLTIPPAQRARIADVDFLPAAVFDIFTHAVAATGTVTFEDCTFGAGQPSSLSVTGTILVERCTFAPGAIAGAATPMGGMRVLGGVCWITDSALAGGAGHFYSGGVPSYVIDPTAALIVQAGTVCVASTTLNGGIGATGGIFGNPVPGAPALIVQGGTASLADCTLNGGSSPANLPGATAAAVSGGSASYARSTFTGGAGVPPGAPSTGLVSQVPELVGMAMPQPFRLGLSSQLIATAATSQLLGMFAAVDHAAATHAIVLGPFLASAPLIPLVAAAPAPGAQVVRVVNVPNQPTLLGATLYAQAFQLDGAFVRASPVVGGVVH